MEKSANGQLNRIMQKNEYTKVFFLNNDDLHNSTY